MKGDEQALQAQFRNAALEIDKSDLRAILELRFGSVPPDVARDIESITDGAAVERLILVAANAADWSTLQAELATASSVFGIVGESFNPISGS